MNQSKICCIFNVAPIYNAAIYKLMDNELNCDFYFGDKIHLPIKLMNYSELKGYKKSLKYVPLFSNFYWQKGAVKTICKPYTDYILTGEVYCLSNWLILLLCLFTNKKTYLWTHGWYGNESIFKRKIKKLFFSLSSHNLLYGDYARELMQNEGISKNKLTCIYNSLDYNNQLIIRQNLKQSAIYTKHFKNQNPVIFYIGRIQNNKRLDLLIDALKILKDNNTDCNLVIIGEEVEKTGIKDQIDKYKLNSHVWMFGACYDELKIAELIYNADICVSPGNVGLTAIHSLMYGTPVITHNDFPEQGPEFEAITNNITGSFFERNNTNDLVDKINFWLNNQFNREITRLNCYKIIDQKYNPNSQIEILKKIVNNKQIQT